MPPAATGDADDELRRTLDEAGDWSPAQLRVLLDILRDVRDTERKRCAAVARRAEARLRKLADRAGETSLYASSRVAGANAAKAVAEEIERGGRA